ncbi:hypothetical protein BZK31_22080 [Pseudomonas floridensis]|uniref:DUF2628 domain-containing protein n=1 Tax=Pseudomonas floridensis TaxID=1958950 RepID=A0A1X0N0V2_9PSED|nr:DUF2628 domain-containing protein [Pseudomonas floridensis]ORC56886.1 hypothetical protein BZK31_22080 [Pseudomonas floridensis]
MNTTEQLQTKRKYSAKWQERFDFFEANGAPKDPGFNAAFKALPGFGKKMLMQMNFIAFFFGPIYLFVLGLWKKNLALLGILIGINIVLNVVLALLGTDLSQGMNTGMNVAGSLMYALTTNYSYYLKEIKGEQGWNPFKGFRLI